MAKNKSEKQSFELSDDDFTDEELAIIYGIPANSISCEEDHEEKVLEEMGAY